MIKQTTELKVRFLIMMIAFLISTYTLMMCFYNGEPIPESFRYFTDKITLPQWTYNPYDYYNSKLENFIILFGYGIFLLMLIDIILICEFDGQNINTRKDNKKDVKHETRFKFLKRFSKNGGNK